jgi:hypothetical protein
VEERLLPFLHRPAAIGGGFGSIHIEAPTNKADLNLFFVTGVYFHQGEAAKVLSPATFDGICVIMVP